MNYTKLKNISKDCIKSWTTLAKQCYFIGGDCKKCYVIPKDIKKQCRMKECIILLTTKLGKPFKRKNNIIYCTPCGNKKNSVK